MKKSKIWKICSLFFLALLEVDTASAEDDVFLRISKEGGLFVPRFAITNLPKIRSKDVRIRCREMVRRLVNNGLSFDYQDKNGQTFLMMAVKCYDVETTKWLLENGVDPNVKNKEGVTPLKHIMGKVWVDFDKATKLEDMIELLVKYGADANETYYDKFSCYSLLSYSLGMFPNPINLVKTLVDHKANINVLCIGVPCVELEKKIWTVMLGEENTPLDIAREKSLTEIAEYLKTKGAKGTKSDSYYLKAKRALFSFFRISNLSRCAYLSYT